MELEDKDSNRLVDFDFNADSQEQPKFEGHDFYSQQGKWYIKGLGPGHIRSFFLLLFPNKAVFQCIPYGKLKKRVKAT